MKYLLLILVLLFSTTEVLGYVPQVHAESIPSVFYCIGDNPQPPCVTPVPTISSAPSNTCTPPAGCFKNGVMICLLPQGTCNYSTPTPTPSNNNPSPSQAPISSNPSPSTNPCVSDQSAGNAAVAAFKKGGKKRRATGNGFIQQFFQFLLQLFQMFFQQMGNQNPGGTVTPTPVPSTSPSTSPSTNPCPSSSPGVSSTPSSNPSTNPTVSQTPTSPSAAPSTSPSSAPAVSPTPESTNPTATPTPSGNPSNNLLQQLLQLLIQLLQQLIQLITGQNPGGTPTPTPAPSTSPSGSVSQTPSNGPSNAPSPTIFGVSPSPSTAPSTATSPSSATSPSTATSPSSATSPSQGPTNPAVPGETGILMSDLNAAGGGKLCMDDKGNSNANNNPVVTWQCNSGDKAQKWTQYSDNSIRINGKCLDVTGQKTAPGSPVAIFTCNGGKNQQWSLVPIASTTSPGRNELKSLQSGLCLDIKGAATANGTTLDIFTCKDAANQAWHWNTGTVTPPGNGGGTATVKNSGQLKSGITAKQLCLDAKGNTAASGTIAQTYACSSADAAQQWKGYSDNTIRFTHNGSTACLDVVGQKTANGTLVDLFTCNGGANQVWTMNGSSQLVSKQSGKCLDIKSASTASPGPQLEIYTCKASTDKTIANQKWSWGTFNGGGGTTSGGGTSQWAYLAPTGLKVTSHTATSVNLSWNAVTGSKPAVSGGVAKPKSYTVAIYTASTGKLMKQVTSSLNATSASVTGLTKNATINIHVWANGGPLAPPNAAINNYKL